MTNKKTGISNSNVIDLNDRRRKLKNWFFSMDFFVGADGKWEGDITGFDAEQEKDMSVGDRMRKMADGLDGISFMMRQQAEKFDKSERGSVVATAHVFHDGTVRTRVNDAQFVNDEQRQWLNERMDDAKGAFFLDPSKEATQ